MADDIPSLVGLEQRLRDDPNGQARDAVVGRLEAALGAVKRQADSGLPPEEFARAERLRQALEAGIAVVQTFSQARAQK